MLALAPPSLPTDHVFVIAHNRTLWGWHLEDGITGNRKAQVVAFQRRVDADEVASRLWMHRLKQRRWPNAVISKEKPLGFVSTDDVLMVSASPLKVDPVLLEDLVVSLGKTEAAVNLVPPMESERELLDLSGAYVAHHTSGTDQRAWLELMAKRARKKKE